MDEAKPISRFLPDGFDPADGVALLAGKGEYPKLAAQRMRDAGVNLKLVAFEGETDPKLFELFDESDRAEINVGQLGKLLRVLKRFGTKHAMMAGQITPKKLFKGMRPDLKAILVLASLKTRNAETIFGAIADQMSNIGVQMLDGRSFLDDCVAPKGFLCGSSWGIKDFHLEHALKIARECAKLDIGQGCVTSAGTVLAVEAFEGTDKMLERCSQFGAKEMLFVKTVKPNQDYRFDVPVVGERTIRKMAEAGVGNLAVEAGKVIILDAPKVKELATASGIRIFGV